MTETKSRVRDALTDVLDPCSCFTDDPVSIVDLGLVEDIHVQGDTAEVELLLTSPGCTYLPYIEREVEERVGNVDGVRQVEVSQITDQIWTRERMADEVRESRRDHLRSRLKDAGVTPYTDHGE